jgi:hypothetical protein
MGLKSSLGITADPLLEILIGSIMTIKILLDRVYEVWRLKRKFIFQNKILMNDKI